MKYLFIALSFFLLLYILLFGITDITPKVIVKTLNRYSLKSDFEVAHFWSNSKIINLYGVFDDNICKYSNKKYIFKKYSDSMMILFDDKLPSSSFLFYKIKKNILWYNIKYVYYDKDFFLIDSIEDYAYVSIILIRIFDKEYIISIEEGWGD